MSQLYGALLAIHEINAAGGIHGLPIRPVCYDARCETARFGALAEKMIVEDRINTIFGCYMSSARKEVLPVVERRNALFFYPTIYEGFEFSRNIFYGGAVPNQNSAPLARFLIDRHGPKIAFVGSDYIYPHEANRAMRQVLAEYGADIPNEWYVPINSPGATLDVVAQQLLNCGADAIFSTVVGQDSINLYRAFHKAGGRGSELPIASLTTNEAEVATMGSEIMAGHLTAAPYFRAINSPENRSFLESYRARYGEVCNVTNAGEASYSQMKLFAMALAKCGLMDTDALRSALLDLSFDAPQGRIFIDPDNQHSYLHSRIARINQDGEYEIEAEIPMAIKPDPYLVNPASCDVRSAAVDTARG